MTTRSDIPANTSSAATLSIGSTVNSGIGFGGDVDWFRVSLRAGRTYVLTQVGRTLGDTWLRGLYDASGRLISGTDNDDFGGTYNSQVTYTATTSGTYFVAAGAYGNLTGSYSLSLRTSRDVAATTATGGQIAPGQSVDGSIESRGDQDWYGVSFTAGRTYVVNLRSDRSAGSPLSDPYFRGIYDSAGRLVAGTTNDDHAGSYDSQVVFRATTSGTFYLAAGAYGNATGSYVLSLTQVTATSDAVADSTATTGRIAVGGAVTGSVDAARDVDWYRARLVAGQRYVIDVKGGPSGNGSLEDPEFVGVFDASGQIVAGTAGGDADGTLEARSVFTPTATGYYYLAVTGGHDQTGTYRLSLEAASASDDIADNAATTASLAVGGALNSSIGSAGDVDWVRVSLQAGTTYLVRQQGQSSGRGTLRDTVIEGIYDSDGRAIAGTSNDDFGRSLDSMVRFTPTASGDYFVAASGYGSATGTYRLSVAARAADTTAPTLAATSPADDATAVAPGASLTLRFSEAVRAGSGAIRITGGGVTRRIAVTDTSQVTFDGAEMRVNPAADLLPNTRYTVTMAAGTIKDVAGNDFAGLPRGEMAFTTGEASAGDEWTILVYVAADNDLEQFAIRDINEMERVNLPDNVNVVTLVDRARGYDTSNGNWTDTRRGHIVQDSNGNTISSPLNSVGELNMGAAQTLTQFLQWGTSTYQSEKVALILWDHGGGLSGVCWDDASGNDNLTARELRQAISASGVGKLDLIGFDACLMGMTEQIFDLRNLTDVVVGSEELEPGDGWAYDDFLADLAADPTMDARGLATSIVDTYADYYAGWDDITLSAVDTSALGALDSALDRFVSVAGGSISSTDWQAMRRAAADARLFPSDDPSFSYRDLGDFMGEVAGNVANTSLRSAANGVVSALNGAVFANQGTVADASGLSIYLPYGSTAVSGSYTATNHAFLNDVNWRGFLASL